MKPFYYLLILLFLARSHAVIAQVNGRNVPATQIPSTLSYQGKLKKALTWTDKQGEHMVLYSVSGPFANKQGSESEGVLNISLHGYHYRWNKDSVKLVWKLQDFVTECPVDISATFIESACQVTDLDADGLPEVWVLYATACRGDVSPAMLKLFCYRGAQKMAMRGSTRVELPGQEADGGEYTMDAAFRKAPVKIQDFAKALWKSNCRETWGHGNL